MKNILLLVRTSVHRNKTAVIFAVILGLIMNLMSNVTSDDTISRMKIGFIDYDSTNLSVDFRRYLSDKLNIELTEDLSYDELSTQLINNLGRILGTRAPKS